MFRPFFVLWLMCVVGTAVAQVPASIAGFLQKHHVSADDFSLVVQDVARDVPLVTLNAQIPRSPASVTKLLTTSAGLIRMGADFRWPTRFYLDNLPDANGVVQGNVYIQGGGDPFLVDEKLQAYLKDLRAKGIRHITGDVVLDNSLYYLPPEARDNESFDGNKWSAYNAVPHPLMVNFRTVKVRLTPNGRQVAVSFWPNIVNWKVDNQMRVSAGACRANYSPAVDLVRDQKGYATVLLSGAYSTACGPRELTVVMGEASEQFYYLFHDLWYQLGGSFDGGGRVGQVPSTAKLIYTGLSEPLSSQIQKMNQYSNNVMTRQLMLTLGTYAFGVPGSLEKGRRAVIETLSAFGVPVDKVQLDNGSGLSRETQLTAHELVTLLLNMYGSTANRQVFVDSLSVAGEVGTLKARFRGEAMQGKVVGKTGTLDGVRAFAGYVFAKSGHVYAVVMIGNGRDAVNSRWMQDDILRWVYAQ